MSLPFKELSDSVLDALIVRERTRVVAPLTEWRVLSAQLRDEGLLRTPALSADPSVDRALDRVMDVPRRRASPFRWGTRLAAGAMLLGGGVLIGRSWTIGSEIIPAIKAAIQVDSVSPVAGSFGSPDQARRVLMRAQGDYQRAAAYLAASEPLEGGDTLEHVMRDPAMLRQAVLPDLRDRLAALDAVTAAAHDAVRDAPQDPLVNLYYMSTMNARAATLHRLDRSLPQGVRLTGY